MDFQIIIVALIIGAASLYVGRIIWKKAKSVGKNSSCEAECGCGSKSKNILTQIKRN